MELRVINADAQGGTISFCAECGFAASRQNVCMPGNLELTRAWLPLSVIA
jgi:hypothetical protein